MTEAERTEYADNLLANTDTLYKRTRDMTFTADQIANGAKGLLDEVATGKVTGEEEYWSRTDLWDFQANVDGARVGFEGVQPIVEKNDAALADYTRALPELGLRGKRQRQREDNRRDSESETYLFID